MIFPILIFALCGQAFYGQITEPQVHVFFAIQVPWQCPYDLIP